MPCRCSPGGEHGNGSGRKRRVEYPVISRVGYIFQPQGRFFKVARNW